MRQVTRYSVIQLAKLALWALQDNCVASTWLLCDNYIVMETRLDTTQRAAGDNDNEMTDGFEAQT
jgi:hypothetical protein